MSSTPPVPFVAVVDSGVGGLTVLRHLTAAVEGERVWYLGDHAWAPYGGRSLDEVERRIDGVVERLRLEGVKMVVLASNTASAAALLPLRRRHPDLPFVGMEPAVRPAARQSTTGVIAVMATNGTLRGELFARVVDRHGRHVRVIPVPAGELVAIVERGEAHEPSTKAYLHELLEPVLVAGADTIVLGCTHFPHVTEGIRAVAGDRVASIDPAPAVARQAVRVLDERGLRRPTGPGGVRYFTTGSPAHFDEQLHALGFEGRAEPLPW